MKKKISPHLNVYKFPIAAVSSITTRITGFGLSGLFIIGGLSCYTNFDYKKIYNKLDDYTKYILNNTVTFACVYHTFGGIRHFIWDKYPKYLTNKSVSKSSYLLFGSSIITTIILNNYNNKNIQNNLI